MSQGSYLRECTVEHSVIGVRSRIETGVTIKAGRAGRLLLQITSLCFESGTTWRGLRQGNAVPSASRLHRSAHAELCGGSSGPPNVAPDARQLRRGGREQQCSHGKQSSAEGAAQLVNTWLCGGWKGEVTLARSWPRAGL